MPLVTPHETIYPHLVYDAPVDEKTKQLRKMFNVDENTGYPEHYSWRPMARLGSHYSYTDPFEKLGKYNPEEYISTKVTMVIFGVAGNAALHWWINYLNSKMFYARLPRFIGLTGITIYGYFWWHEKTLQRQAQRNHVTIDYVTKHPERFEKIHRPKIREVLAVYCPSR